MKIEKPSIITTFDVTRNLDTIYQNNARSRIVSTSIICEATGAGSEADVQVLVGATSPPMTPIKNVGIFAAHAAETLDFDLEFIVPPNYYWKIVKNVAGALADVTLGYVNETEL